jgi:hypothetical protein
LIEHKELEIATTLLHNLGSIIYFGDDEKLADVIILDPQWLTNVMSSIVTTKHSYVAKHAVGEASLALISFWSH